MILVLTHSQDLSADFVIRHLIGRCRFRRVDTDLIGTSKCFFGYGRGPELHIDDEIIYASEISAVWARRFALPKVLNEVQPKHVDFVRRELAVVMDAFLENIAHAFYINASYADRLAGNRLIQAERAKQLGFLVPDTIVTQSAVTAESFLRQNPSVITKALSFGRVSNDPGEEQVAFSSIVPKNIDLSTVESCPALFQTRLPKRFDWRITTVGNKVFSARTLYHGDRPPIDWREDRNIATSFEATYLPDGVTERLLSLCSVSELVYGAHDLVETDSGEFFFLETNPAGQWGWLELSLGFPIGKAVADELIAHSG